MLCKNFLMKMALSSECWLEIKAEGTAGKAQDGCLLSLVGRRLAFRGHLLLPLAKSWACKAPLYHGDLETHSPGAVEAAEAGVPTPAICSWVPARSRRFPVQFPRPILRPHRRGSACLHRPGRAGGRREAGTCQGHRADQREANPASQPLRWQEAQSPALGISQGKSGATGQGKDAEGWAGEKGGGFRQSLTQLQNRPELFFLEMSGFTPSERAQRVLGAPQARS